MDTHRETALPPAITGTLMHLGERHKVAFYLRNQASCVAEFRDGRGELTTATHWFRFHAGPLRYCHNRRAATLETTTALTPEIVEEIERLHRREDARDAMILNIPTAVLGIVQRCWTELGSKMRGLGSKRMPRLG